MNHSLKKSMLEMLNQVQHDGIKVLCHSEFISESNKIRPQVQHDKRGIVPHDTSFSIRAKLWAHKIFARTCPQFKKQLTGRSMIEMLGVLAIIGVLSIGAFQGYRTAVTRYRADQVMDFLQGIHFIWKDMCQQTEGCIFEPKSTFHYGVLNREKLCSLGGSIYCDKTQTNVVPFSFLPEVTWIIEQSVDSPKVLILSLRGASPALCTRLVDYDYPDIYWIWVGTNQLHGPAEGSTVLSPLQKKRLKEACLADDYNRPGYGPWLVFAWK